MNQFFVIRMDDDGDYVDDWEAVADSFTSEEEAREFVRMNAGAHPGVKYIVARALAVGESPIPNVTFTEIANA